MTVINASLLALLLCLPATLLASDGGGINAEIKREMASSRVEVRAELDRARAELEQQNLSLRDSLAVGRRGQSSPSSRDLADAQITPDGVLLIAGTAVATSTAQQQRLRDYRRQVLDMAQIGIDGGEKAAMAALEATDVSLFRMIVGGVSGSLQRRAEKAALQQIAPMVAQICQRLPAVLSLQQSLASDLPAFQPYATLEQRDIDHCQRELGRSIALR